MDDEGVVDLLVAVERVIEEHSDDLDALNVFPVPDADTGRNVLATVRSARAAAEQAGDGGRRSHAVIGALRGARGNAGVLTSQLLRALVEPDAGGWATRLRRADDLCRAAVAHPVEGSFLTAVRSAADAAGAAAADDANAQLAAATAAAHAAVRDSPTLLEVLARAGVVDSGARAAALVLEAVAAHIGGHRPDPPDVEVPAGGPDVSGCTPDESRFEVMYLLDPDDDLAVDVVRDGLARVGGSVVVVEADRLVSVHVHTDDIGAAVDVGLAHGRPHNIRVEDLHEGARTAATRGQHPARGAPRPTTTGLVVAADGEGIARLAAATGAITLALGSSTPGPDEIAAAAARTGRDRVLLLPASADLARVGALLDDDRIEVVTAVDGPARLLAALAVLDPSAPDAALLADVASEVTEGSVVVTGDRCEVVTADRRRTVAGGALDGLSALLAALGPEAELVTLLLGADVGVAIRDAATTAVAHHWPDADVDVVDVGLGRATFVVGVE